MRANAVSGLHLDSMCPVACGAAHRFGKSYLCLLDVLHFSFADHCGSLIWLLANHCGFLSQHTHSALGKYWVW